MIIVVIRMVQISSQASVGSFVTRVEASDRDVARNAELTYSISSGNPDNLFMIDSTTGVIVINKEMLDATRGASKLYSLVVVVKDDGVPPLMTVESLHVLANSSSAVAPPASEPLTFDAMPNLVILIGAVLGFILVLTIVIVLAVVCVKRHGRKARRKYLAEAVAVVQAQSSLGSCHSPGCSLRGGAMMSHHSHHNSRQLAGSQSTVDTNSVVMSNGAVPNHVIKACQDWRKAVEEEEQDSTGELYADPWSPQQDSRIITVGAEYYQRFYLFKCVFYLFIYLANNFFYCCYCYY